jgi:hypothetical protein
MLSRTTSESPSLNGESLTLSDWKTRNQEERTRRKAEDNDPEALERRKKELEEFDQEISQIIDKGNINRFPPLDIRVGRVMKTRVIIDKDRVTFGGKSIKCESVIALGWWAQTTKNLEWAQGEWTTGWVWLKSGKKKIKLTVPGAQEFGLITNALWRFVGFRMLSDIAQKLDEECDVNLCGLKLNSKGVELGKFGAGDAIVPWKKIRTSHLDGKLRIESRAEKRRKESMSFRSTDNLPVLDALLTVRRNKLMKKLSWSQAARF